LFHRSRCRPWLAVFVVWCLCAGAVRADPTVTGSATLQGDGSYLYQYTLTNPASAGLPLQQLGLTGLWPTAFGLTFDLQNVSQPSGWTFAYEANLGYLWSTTSGLGPGQTALFSFTTHQPPIQVGYFAATVPYYHGVPSDTIHSDSYGGQVAGPGIPGFPGFPPFLAPEPASAFLLVTGGGLLLLRQWRRR
jgi:hypothetical protein